MLALGNSENIAFGALKMLVAGNYYVLYPMLALGAVVPYRCARLKLGTCTLSNNTSHHYIGIV